MKFGPVPLSRATGTILAHSLKLGKLRLKKGRALTARDVAALAEAGVDAVTVAEIGPEDMPEDEAAAAIAAALLQGGEAGPITVSAPFTGRANLFAEEAGVLRVDVAMIAAVNAIDEAVTIATLPDHARLAPRQMAATVKIIPYAAPRDAVERACALLRGAPAMRAHRFALTSTSLILTRTPGMKASVLEKGADAVRARLVALGVDAVDVIEAAHETGALASAIGEALGEAVLILTASATSDRRDVGPAAVEAAGGRIERFGMPVDPGNLLFLGSIGARPVIGLPGCARSPKLNGADWVLERVAAGLEMNAADIGAMGVGGLLKEIPSRPEPRAGGSEAPRRPSVSAMLLAAGASRRMRGRDKLMEEVGGEPLLARMIGAAAGAQVDELVVVTGPEDVERRALAEGAGALLAVNPNPAEGMGASIRSGIAALSPDADAVIILLSDMPEITSDHLNRLIAAFDPAEGRSICRAASESGRAGHPVLFGRRFFETLARLEGDSGARRVLDEHAEHVELVPTPGEGATIDLDTPEAWAAWRATS